MIKVYGIPNCDTIKKTLTWLKANNVPFLFHDYRKEGVSKETIAVWLKSQPLEKVLNRASTTWKGLSPEEKIAAEKPDAAIALMVSQPSMIKRPLIEAENGTVLTVGFSEKVFDSLLK